MKFALVVTSVLLVFASAAGAAESLGGYPSLLGVTLVNEAQGLVMPIISERASSAQAEPIERVDMNEACTLPQWATEFSPPTLEDAREFVLRAARVDSEEWHYQSVVIACEYSGEVMVEGSRFGFTAYPTGTGWVWSLPDGGHQQVLCYECTAWQAGQFED
jgi:hypothetical protein